ncbi:MAG: hypothetical protein LUO80_05400 [Methylococcaceae bacterium]|jgi:hypothetical protein|nr:hypothetical protein [Methylococcaceae bacterium]
MKKLLILALTALALVGCAKKEKTGLREVLIERFKDDQDLKDYKLDPGVVADCVVDEIAGSLPGFAGDPRRAQFFEAYARFLNVKSSADAENSIAEFEQLFGSKQQARQAATSITDHVMTCMGKSIEGASSDGHRSPLDAP